MKVILAAGLATIVIAFGSNAVLTRAGFSAEESTSGAAVRLD